MIQIGNDISRERHAPPEVSDPARAELEEQGTVLESVAGVRAHANPGTIDVASPPDRSRAPKVRAVASGGGHWVQLLRL